MQASYKPVTAGQAVTIALRVRIMGTHSLNTTQIPQEEGMTSTNWQADPLHWGSGPNSFEVFVEPTCPFSVKALAKLEPLLSEAGRDRVTVKLRLHSQPWHLHSGVVTRCVLAASTLENGREQAWAVLEAVADHREEFVCENHCTGPNRRATLDDIIARIERYSGIELSDAFAIPDLDREIKWHSKYARQNGVHGSPTFMLNGLIRPEMGSGDSAHDWADAIRANIIR